MPIVSPALCANLYLGKNCEGTHIGGESKQGLTCTVHYLCADLCPGKRGHCCKIKASMQMERVKVSPALCADLCPGKRGHCGEGIYAGALQVRSAAGWQVQHLHAERHVLGQAVVQEPLQHLTCAVTQRSCIAGRRQVCLKDIQSSSQSSEKWEANLNLLIENKQTKIRLF